MNNEEMYETDDKSFFKATAICPGCGNEFDVVVNPKREIVSGTKYCFGIKCDYELIVKNNDER